MIIQKKRKTTQKIEERKQEQKLNKLKKKAKTGQKLNYHKLQLPF